MHCPFCGKTIPCSCGFSGPKTGNKTLDDFYCSLMISRIKKGRIPTKNELNCIIKQYEDVGPLGIMKKFPKLTETQIYIILRRLRQIGVWLRVKEVKKNTAHVEYMPLPEEIERMKKEFYAKRILNEG